MACSPCMLLHPARPTHTFPWLAARVCPCTLPGLPYTYLPMAGSPCMSLCPCTLHIPSHGWQPVYAPAPCLVPYTYLPMAGSPCMSLCPCTLHIPSHGWQRVYAPAPCQVPRLSGMCLQPHRWTWQCWTCYSGTPCSQRGEVQGRRGAVSAAPVLTPTSLQGKNVFKHCSNAM